MRCVNQRIFRNFKKILVMIGDRAQVSIFKLFAAPRLNKSLPLAWKDLICLGYYRIWVKNDKIIKSNGFEARS